MYSILTRAWLWMPAWRKASLSDLYESERSTYLPHIAIVTSRCGCSTSSTSLSQRVRFAGLVCSCSLAQISSSRPCACSMRGTL